MSPNAAEASTTALANVPCEICKEPIPDAHAVHAGDHSLHRDCFLCHHCLLPFPEDSFIAFDGGLYCEQDYALLYGERCARCADLITGRCVNAMDAKWHPEHFTCDVCGKVLSGGNFTKRKGMPHCRGCFPIEPSALQMEECGRCKQPIDVDEPTLTLADGIKYHARHFTCTLCKTMLTQNCKGQGGKLYCAGCFEQLGLRICVACHRPIGGRVITALGKQYHPEHFVCTKCERPFQGSRYWEYQEKPYCELHYNEMIGAMCGYCYEPVEGAVVTALNRKWCCRHFMCVVCNSPLLSESKSRYFEWDLKPMCGGCFDGLPLNERKQLHSFISLQKKCQQAIAAAAAKRLTKARKAEAKR
ncbi:hypothetical protein CXG81DRAFT_12822 [Caulochytrium protostelioides]|uniref:LIM zinc-binding domain-containing protein n=1 Tax=Caulochytrium protostelioides TaxID=1555241 RepID=A0A4P9X6J2_9FUNG|nr:hypothetical protein CXG81DRAFT_12822 [Caulochytrium protostelioides]|eukprot:RKP00782.1 hypothetical protein CXG81DRAFT_12822 [Caulochytrium protostelioides]